MRAYSNNSFGFTFEFIRSKEPTNDPINDSISSGLSKIEKSVLELLDAPQRYSKSDIAAKIGKSPATVQRAIKRLMELGLIKRVGSNKKGFQSKKDLREEILFAFGGIILQPLVRRPSRELNPEYLWAGECQKSKNLRERKIGHQKAPENKI